MCIFKFDLAASFFHFHSHIDELTRPISQKEKGKAIAKGNIKVWPQFTRGYVLVFAVCEGNPDIYMVWQIGL